MPVSMLASAKRKLSRELLGLSVCNNNNNNIKRLQTNSAPTKEDLRQVTSYNHKGTKPALHTGTPAVGQRPLLKEHLLKYFIFADRFLLDHGA